MSVRTLQSKMEAPGGFTTGFDYLRISLSLSVLFAHSVAVGSGDNALLWSGPWRCLFSAILPMFFSLSGFLVTGSLNRVKLHQFVVLRLVRLIPALAVEITLSAVVIGSLVTSLPWRAYFLDHEFFSYFMNIIGVIHYDLPGVFAQNPFPKVMNFQLWTIPFEFECYACLLALAILRITRRRDMFVGAVCAICVVMTVRIFLAGTISHTSHEPGRMLIAAFLAGVAIYLYRDLLPYSNRLGLSAIAVSLVLLRFPELCYLSAFPVAYATIWLGLMRPPAIPFGDLSYGVYLFHFPIEQTVVFALPGARAWWLLSLITIPLTTLCAWLSWTFIEQPTLVRKKAIIAASDRAFAVVQMAGRHLRRGKSTSPADEPHDATANMPESIVFELDPRPAA